MVNFMNSRVGIFTSCMCSYGTKTHYERTFLKKKTNNPFIPQERKVTQKEKIVLFTGTVFYSIGI